MANVVNKNKFNPVNAEYLTQALSVKTAKELPYSWTFGDLYFIHVQIVFLKTLDQLVQSRQRVIGDAFYPFVYRLGALERTIWFSFNSVGKSVQE